MNLAMSRCQFNSARQRFSASCWSQQFSPLPNLSRSDKELQGSYFIPSANKVWAPKGGQVAFVRASTSTSRAFCFPSSVTCIYLYLHLSPHQVIDHGHIYDISMASVVQQQSLGCHICPPLLLSYTPLQRSVPVSRCYLTTGSVRRAWECGASGQH